MSSSTDWEMPLAVQPRPENYSFDLEGALTSLVGLRALQLTGEPIAIGTNDIGGLVTSAKGPEAGVWVIAETTELPTKFVKIVVTDDRGRYLIPDLPQASYSVWVRGYGLVDSPKVQSTPGKIVNLPAVVAPNPRAATEYYPAAGRLEEETQLS